jgi:Aminoglycoside-2''-adenylyltransferase
LSGPAPDGAFDPNLAAWAPWRPEQVARRLEAVEAPWYVAAGWAIELFLGSEHREHEDIEIAVPARRFGEVAAALAGLDLYVIGPDLAAEHPAAGEEHGPALATPLGQAGALLDTYHQTWALEPATRVWRLDVFREEGEGETWICRRDARIRLPYAELIEWTDDGVPYARPEVVLLFKAKAARPKDEADLAAVLPRLAPAARRWLRDAVALVHPGHRWLAEL